MKVLSEFNQCIGKKVMFTNLDKEYDFLYIIFEDKSIICFEVNDDIIDVLSYYDITRELFCSIELLEKFRRLDVVSDETYDKIKKEIYDSKLNQRKNLEQQEYNQYLKLKEKYESQ